VDHLDLKLPAGSLHLSCGTLPLEQLIKRGISIRLLGRVFIHIQAHRATVEADVALEGVHGPFSPLWPYRLSAGKNLVYNGTNPEREVSP
jgi:hypothetical protein